MSVPFTAARARNAGFRRLLEVSPDLDFVQFVDGDCEINAGWLEIAASFLSSRTDVAAVAGRLRERHPDRSVYNWLCGREWDGPAGEVRACGGIVMMRATALETVGGYRDDLIAGEEPELCVRLRAKGWRIWRLDAEMALHDAAMTQFSQWWRRAARAGYAFAQGAYLHGGAPERHWVWESRRAWLWGMWLPLMCLACALVLGPWGWVGMVDLSVAGVAADRAQSWPVGGPGNTGVIPGVGAIPRGLGQIRFLRDRCSAGRRGSSNISDGAMRVAYLINQYPKVSHTFIRREILALERQGVTVMRVRAARLGWRAGGPGGQARARAHALRAA